MLISEAFSKYQQDYMIIRCQSRRMVETHNHVQNSLIQVLGDIPIEDMTLDDIKRWHSRRSRNCSQNTMRNDMTRIRCVMKYLELRDVKCIKPALIVVPKRVDTEVEYLDAEEVAEMIKCAWSLRNKFIISLLFSSGIRLSEFINLDRDQIRDKKFTVIGKGGKARLCFTDERTMGLMKEYLEVRHDRNKALVVSELYKDRMTATNVQLLIKNSAKRAGIDRRITPHTLRHSFATNFLKNGGDVRCLQMMLGHASLNTTMKYTHLVDNDLEERYRKYHTV